MTLSRLHRVAGEGRLIPVVGAGIPMGVKSKDGSSLFPSWKSVLENAASLLKKNASKYPAMAIEGLVGIGGCENYLRAAQIAEESLASDWNGFLDRMFKRAKSEVDLDTLVYAKAIWDIGSRLIITTNYDKTLEWSCPDEDVDFIGNRQAAELSQLLTSEYSNSAVWHIHGSVLNKADIILGEKSYHNFYGKTQGGDDSQPVALQTFRAVLSSYTLIFIGFSMTDDYIRAQLEDIYTLFKGANKHYIILHETERGVFESRGVSITPIYVSNFDTDLLQKLSSLRRKQAHSQANKVSLKLTPELRRAWEDDLRERRLKENSIRSMRIDVRKFAEYFPDDIANLTDVDILAWLESNRNQGSQKGTVKRRLTSIKNLYPYLIGKGLVLNDPTYRLKLSKHVPGVDGYISELEINKAMGSLPGKTPLERRDAALFKSTYYCGLRSEEISSLCVEDLDMKDQIMTVRNGHDSIRRIHVHDDAWDAILLWLEKHPAGQGALFCSMRKPHNPLSSTQVRNNIGSVFERVGLNDGKFNPRNLRHSRGFHLAENNVNPLDVSRLLGHKSVYSTSRYYNR